MRASRRVTAHQHDDVAEAEGDARLARRESEDAMHQIVVQAERGDEKAGATDRREERMIGGRAQQEA